MKVMPETEQQTTEQGIMSEPKKPEPPKETNADTLEPLTNGQLFRFASGLDKLIMLIGGIFSIGAGAAMPFMT